MGSFGSPWNPHPRAPFLGLVLAGIFAVGALVAGCGDKPRADSPNNGHKGEITDPANGGGTPGVPPLESVEPAEHDIEVPPAP
jgi:hypothetical protein